ncbi:MAG: DUF748 domain-containing protein [Sphingobacteriales bacterium JAD_PAG50586_3]|nr:MAG: DUF748 domain-containing protein [Sphingobacteriales bacterium JAD_PAG50586_3]
MGSTQYKVQKKWFRLVCVLLPVISIVNTLFPFILRRFANKKLRTLKGHYSEVKKIKIGAKKILIEGFLLDKLDKESGGRNKFLSAETVVITFNFKELWGGIFIADVFLERPVFTHINKEDDKTTGPTVKRKTNITHLNLFPFVVNKLEVKNGTVEYIDTLASPIVRLDLSKLYIRATSVSNIPEFAMPAEVMVLGKAYGGSIQIKGKVNLQKLKPDFDINAEVENIELNRLNNLFEAYGKFSIDNGGLSVYAEAVSVDGHYKGYVKPVVTGIVITAVETEKSTLWRSIWESAVGKAIKLFENPKEEQVATKIPIEGEFKDIEINVWYAIVVVLRNAFISALTPSIDYEINFNTLKRSKGTNNGTT